jgi:hypothetical protein
LPLSRRGHRPVGPAVLETEMLHCRLWPACLTAGLLVASTMFADAGEPRALLELFTSQGCSSCPAADKLAGELAADPSLVVISVPIDYWDYLGWKDTLASPAHSARQRAYARVRGDRQVYTPQVVVNGSIHAVAIERAVVQTDRNPAVMSVPVLAQVDGDKLDVKVGAAKDAKDRGNGEVWLLPLARAVQVEIGRGENRGRTITYTNVVRHWVKLGDWSGNELNWNVPLSEVSADHSDGVAVIIQQGTHEKPGAILGTAFAPIGRQTTQRGPEPTDDQ